MPQTPSQRARNALRQPRLPKLVIGPGAVCAVCGHPRSSHSMLIIFGCCKADGCEDHVFDSFCGCGHLLVDHTWGTAPHPWECAMCACSQFGPAPDQAQQLTLSFEAYILRRP